MPEPASFSEIAAYIARGGQALGIVPSWMVHAMAEIGTAEFHGSKHNPRIMEYWRGAGMKEVASTDETPWCAAFVGAMLKGSGIERAAANAKSYLNWGAALDIATPKPPLGAVIVLNRPPVAWQGHVFFCAGVDGNKIHGLGGNQGDRVSIASFDRERVAGIRWPAQVPFIGTNILLPVSAVNPTTS